MDKTAEIVLLIISLIACAPFSYLLLSALASIGCDVIAVIFTAHKERRACSKTETRSLR